MQFVETAAAAPLPPRTATLFRARQRALSRSPHRRFGRSPLRRTAEPAPLPVAPPVVATPIGSALGLFAMTFLAGFLFVSILLA